MCAIWAHNAEVNDVDDYVVDDVSISCFYFVFGCLFLLVKCGSNIMMGISGNITLHKLVNGISSNNVITGNFCHNFFIIISLEDFTMNSLLTKSVGYWLGWQDLCYNLGLYLTSLFLTI